MHYLAAFPLCCLLLLILVLSHRQTKLLRVGDDPFKVIKPIISMNLEQMQELFDPVEEQNLRSRNTPNVFKTIQANRRRLRIQYVVHVYRNAGLIQRLGGAAIRTSSGDRLLLGRTLLNSGVAVRTRSSLLLVLLWLQDVAQSGSYNRAVKNAAAFLLPHKPNRIHYDDELFALIPLTLQVDRQRMHELFNPAQEWKLRVKIGVVAFRAIQANRRRLAIQYASHMYRNARLFKRLAEAGMCSGKMDRVLLGKALLDAAVAVRLRSKLLLFFLRFQQLVYTGSDLNALRDIVKDLMPDYDHMAELASALSQALDPRLHDELLRLL